MRLGVSLQALALRALNTRISSKTSGVLGVCSSARMRRTRSYLELGGSKSQAGPDTEAKQRHSLHELVSLQIIGQKQSKQASSDHS